MFLLAFVLIYLECAFPFSFINTGKETEFLLFSHPKRIYLSFNYFSVYSYIKCIYLSGIKKKHTKAPMSLHFTALEENNFMKNTERRSIKPESGTPAITEAFEVEFFSLLPVFTQRCYDSLGETLPQHCLRAAQLMHLRSLWQPEWHHVTVKDNQSQSMGQCWETKKTR